MKPAFEAIRGISMGDLEHWISLFWSKVNRSGSCWLWTGQHDKDGYGKFQISLRGKNRQVHIRAHRFSVFLFTGELGKIPLHECNTPACVRPDHLKWGTQSENVIETVIRRTHRSVKLKPENVLEIRRRYATGESALVIAHDYSVSRESVYNIAHGRSWKWLKVGRAA